jgi:hypothetical protein
LTASSATAVTQNTASLFSFQRPSRSLFRSNALREKTDRVCCPMSKRPFTDKYTVKSRENAAETAVLGPTQVSLPFLSFLAPESATARQA